MRGNNPLEAAVEVMVIVIDVEVGRNAIRDWKT
jgi:hypothetical protein